MNSSSYQNFSNCNYSIRHGDFLKTKFLIQRLNTIHTLIVVSILLAGCDQGVKPVAEVRDPPPTFEILDAQLAAVRKDSSREIRFTSQAILAEHALQIARCTNIEVLEIDHSNLSNEQLTSLISSLPELHQLKLAGPVNGEQLQKIAADANNLRTLNLPNGEFSDDDLNVLAAHVTLEFLRFHSQNVGDTGLHAIAQIPNLRFLHVIDVPISDAGLVHLYDLERLESFYLDGSDCTEDGLSKLIQKRPDLHFHWNQLHLKSDPKAHKH